MNRDTLLRLFNTCRDEICQRFGVTRLSLFGSAARDELRADSDIDVLVEFSAPVSFDTYFALKDYLEAMLGRKVDLVTEKGLKPRARRDIAKDLVRVA